MPAFAKSHFEEPRASGFLYRLQPLKDIYFGNVQNGDFPMGNISYVIMLIGVAVILTCIATLNFINLSIILGVVRSREFGIRKVLGASGLKIWWKSFLETSIIVSLSIISAYLINYLFLDYLIQTFNVPEEHWINGY